MENVRMKFWSVFVGVFVWQLIKAGVRKWRSRGRE